MEGCQGETGEGDEGGQDARCAGEEGESQREEGE